MPAEWIYEAGIGETRAALIQDGTIIEARIERHGPGPRAGAVLAARLGETLPGGTRAVALLPDGGTALLRPIPRGVAQGGQIMIVITREAIPERGNPKPPQARPARDDDTPGDAPGLIDIIAASGTACRRLHAHEPDALEAAGWSEVLDEAATGLIAFTGGLLRLSLTPAMSLFDVDGHLPPAELAIAGSAAAGAAIRRLDIGGSIGIDLPTTGDKEARQRAAAALDAALPQPFERTAVNGFGFLQIVRARHRACLPELVQSDPALAAALALLRRAERAGGRGRRTLSAAPVVIARILPAWREDLARRTGADVALRELPGAAISAGDVDCEHPI